MYPVTTWLQPRRRYAEHAWSVEGRLRERGRLLRSAKGTTVAPEDGFIILALLFSLPHTEVMSALAQSGEFFHRRSGETWDLLLPGYHALSNVEKNADRGRFGPEFTAGWQFYEPNFRQMADELERESEGAWRFSGGSDLVIMSAHIAGPPIIDWQSAIGWQLEQGVGGGAAAFGGAVETITRSVSEGRDDEDLGVDGLFPSPPNDHRVRGIVEGALVELLTSLGVRATGL